ncbi:MAG: cell division protein ZapA [Treponema sp.]|nr:cell division protein ZapA [Treponema sp.]
MAVNSGESSFLESGSKSGRYDLDIDVLGARFTITTGEDPEHLNEVLKQYQLAVARTQDIPGMKDQDPIKVAILTGFLLCDDINKLKLQVEEEQSATEKELNHVTKNLMLRLDRVIKKGAP